MPQNSCINCHYYRPGGVCGKTQKDISALTKGLACFVAVGEQPESEETEETKAKIPATKPALRCTAISMDYEGSDAIADYLGISIHIVRHLLKQNRIPGVALVAGKKGRPCWGINEADLEAFKQQRLKEDEEKAERKTERATDKNTRQPKQVKVKEPSVTLADDELAGMSAMADYMGYCQGQLCKVHRNGLFAPELKVVNGRKQYVATKGQLDDLKALLEKRHEEHMKFMREASISAAKKRREEKEQNKIIPNSVVINDPRPRPHFTDRELVVELRNRGWEVTCTRTRREEL